MLRHFWAYMIEKNWQYDLIEDARTTNIFCYGKKKSGKTDKVAKPVVRHALSGNRSCIIYAENAQKEYADIQHEALAKGYKLHTMDAATTLPSNSMEEINSILADIENMVPTLVMVNNITFTKPFQYTVVDYLLDQLSHGAEYDQEEDALQLNDRTDSTLFVLDGLCGNMVIPSRNMKNPSIQLCITMESDVAYHPWRDKQIDTVFDSDILPESIISDILDKDTDAIARRFFTYIETVICTGVAGIKKEMHWEFIGRCMFDKSVVRLGGRYIILERYPDKIRRGAKMMGQSRTSNVAIDEENLTDSTYSEVAEKAFVPGNWLIEKVGHPAMLYDNGIYFPLVFETKGDAVSWMSIKMRNDGISVRNTEHSEDMIRYDCVQDGREFEYCILKIEEKDIDTHLINYYTMLLYMAELDDLAEWLQTEEAIAMGFDPEDGIMANMEKYYRRLDEMESEIKDVEDGEKAAPQPHIPAIERYWEKYNQKENSDENTPEVAPATLPENGVLFLGGHRNMQKKIQQLHPNWLFITDDEFKPYSVINVNYVFYWTNHSSHMMMENIFSKLTPNAEIMYVTATNMNRLEQEMQSKFEYNKTRKRRGAQKEA